VACAVLWCVAALAASPGYSGRRLTEVLHELGLQGLRLIYSSETVPESLRVLREPVGDTPGEVLAEVLAPHGLEANRVGENAYAIVRAQAPPVTPAGPAPASPPVVPATARLEEIVVASSRYSLSADVPDPHTLLTQEEIEGLPRFAEDALKAVHRLPGAASNGLSGLANIRGGETNETLVVLDGLPLYDPFHLQLLLSPASLLDPRILSGLDVHAGGFTAEFGDRMSAVIEATSVRPEADRYYELGLSLFHAQALAAQRFADGRGQWLAAVRRSNLDEVADFVESEIGEASYVDGFGRVDYEFSPQTRGRLHVLLSADSAEVINAAETEFAEADYRNSYFWATLEHDFSDALAAGAILSYTEVSVDRTGEVDEAGRRIGAVDDEREYDVLGLKLDGRYSTPRWLHRFGLELRRLSAEYDYASAVRFEPGYPFPEAGERVTVRTLDPDPSGAHVAAYATGRVLATDRLAVELGLRWDDADLCGDRQRPAVEPANQPALPGPRHHAPARQLGALRPVPGHQRAAGRGRNRRVLPDAKGGSRDPGPRAGVAGGLFPARRGLSQGLPRTAAALREPVRPAVAGAGAALGPRAHRPGLRACRGRRVAAHAPERRPVERLAELHVVTRA
jgi:hypothetical protein